jgi:hypothetical protein
MNKVPTRKDLLEIVPKGGVIAELGVFQGEFADTIFKVCEPSRLYLVDKWSGRCASGDVNGENRIVLSKREVRKIPNLLREKYNNDNIKVIQSSTWEFLRYYDEYVPLDMVYIDAGHTYECVIADLMLSLKKVRDGGFIMGHDYTITNPKTFGVYHAVNDFCKWNNLSIGYLTTDEKQPSYCIRKD